MDYCLKSSSNRWHCYVRSRRNYALCWLCSIITQKAAKVSREELAGNILPSAFFLLSFSPCNEDFFLSYFVPSIILYPMPRKNRAPAAKKSSTATLSVSSFRTSVLGRSAKRQLRRQPRKRTLNNLR